MSERGACRKTIGEGLVERVAIAGQHAALLDALRDLQRDAAVLDLGCGTGAWLERLAAAGFSNLTGVDADASQFAARRARLVVADLDRGELPLPERHFALISAIEVIEHLENVGGLLSIAARHLAPGGVVLVTTPNASSLRARVRWLVTGNLPFFDGKGEPTHLSPIFPPLLERMLVRRALVIHQRWTWPESGSVLFRPLVRLAARLLRLVAPDPLPGDVLVLAIGRQGDRALPRLGRPGAQR